MTLAALLELVQILSAAGSAAVDLTKIVEAVRKRGGSTLTSDETAQVTTLASGHMLAIKHNIDPYVEMTQLEETSGA